MSDRHMHITSYLYDADAGRLAAFEAEARKAAARSAKQLGRCQAGNSIVATWGCKFH